MTAVAAAAGALIVGGAGLVSPRVVAGLPRPRDLLAGEPGPDYSRLARARGLGPVAAGVGAAVGALLGWRLGLSGAAPYWHLAAVGLVLVYVDIRVHRLPDALVLPSLGVAPLLVGGLSIGGGDLWSLVRALAGMAAAWAAFGLLHTVQPSGLGLGDVKLAAWTGLVTPGCHGRPSSSGSSPRWASAGSSPSECSPAVARGGRRCPSARCCSPAL